MTQLGWEIEICAIQNSATQHWLVQKLHYGGAPPKIRLKSQSLAESLRTKQKALIYIWVLSFNLLLERLWYNAVYYENQLLLPSSDKTISSRLIDVSWTVNILCVRFKSNEPFLPTVYVETWMFCSIRYKLDMCGNVFHIKSILYKKNYFNCYLNTCKRSSYAAKQYWILTVQ